MAEIVFLLGRPGSGKSTAARYISMLAKDHQWSIVHINDYEVLKTMFEEDVQRLDTKKKFLATKWGGFDVLDFSVLDHALQRIEAQAQCLKGLANTVLLIEFARDDYRAAFKQFHSDFLQDAYFLFFDADIDICIERINMRSRYPASPDDHFISEKMLRSYYSKKHISYMLHAFSAEFEIGSSRIRVIENMGAWKEFGEQLNVFIKFLSANHRRIVSPQEIVNEEQHITASS